MKKPVYAILVLSASLIIAAALIVILVGPQTIMMRVMGAPDTPDDLDTATMGQTDQGIYQVSYASSTMPIPINQIHTWIIHVESVAGQPIEQAEITVNGGMPEHGHGLPTKPQVTQDLGNGDYQVEGMKFNMPGWWQVTFYISANGQNDSSTFNLVLK